jgi:hypothetical protein
VKPFLVIKSVNLNAYKVDFPEMYGKLYRTFLVSLLELYSRRKGEKSPGPVDLDEEDRFLVKSIRKERVSNKET